MLKLNRSPDILTTIELKCLVVHRRAITRLEIGCNMYLLPCLMAREQQFMIKYLRLRAHLFFNRLSPRSSTRTRNKSIPFHTAWLFASSTRLSSIFYFGRWIYASLNRSICLIIFSTAVCLPLSISFQWEIVIFNRRP
ncbi:hypothetical protein GGR55DRAFT_54672 [Xylaria sp. FL0064]|nr:hypothetical protein GGR55DRAFT_54672 [Xylaria sp. FL0064]